MAALATVQIVDAGSDSGFLIINEADFDPKQHKLFGEKSKPAATDAEQPEQDAPKRGRKPAAS